MNTTIRDDDLGSLSDLFVASHDRPQHLQSLTPEDLPAFARVLLVTDGTVTHMLRAHYREPIHVDVLDHTFEVLSEPLPWLQASTGDEILIRKVALKGARSGTIYCQATSWIALERLTPQMREDIIQMRRSIGHVLLANFSENRRELLWYGAANTSSKASEGEPLPLERAYRVISQEHPLMIISETFAPLISRPSSDS